MDEGAKAEALNMAVDDQTQPSVRGTGGLRAQGAGAGMGVIVAHV
jgi:hypothetical protein